MTGSAAAERVLELPSDPSSARTARHMLQELLSAAGHEEWAEPAGLACTELVTNAVLHAHTGVTVSAEVRADGLFVAVRDGSRDLPRQRSSDTRATTGRGMLLVARLVSEHGVSLDADGKTVWFTIRGAVRPDEREPTVEDLLSLWGDDEVVATANGPVEPPRQGAPAAEQPRSTTAVRLERMPPTLWLAATEHHQTVLRELVLYLAEHPDEHVDMAQADSARTLLDDAVGSAVERSRREGTARSPLPDDHPVDLPWTPEHVTLSLTVPDDGRSSFAALQDALDLAEQLARAGLLLARPGLPEVVAVRDWACEQVVAQLGGATASAWQGADHERFLAQQQPREGAAGPVVEVVRSTQRAVVAADDSNRIVAVSAAMAAMVLWDVDALVGRRVVTLVPARLREAHVAGFSRHLSSGEARLLGVPLVLPVLRADGTEVRCRVVIEQVDADRGRRLYLAWFDPPERDGP